MRMEIEKISNGYVVTYETDYSYPYYEHVFCATLEIVNEWIIRIFSKGEA